VETGHYSASKYSDVVEEEEENLFTKKAGCQKGLQPINAGYHSKRVKVLSLTV